MWKIVQIIFKSWTLEGRGSKSKEQIGQLFEHELQLSSSNPQRIVIDYSSPNIAKASWTTGAPKLWISCMGDELRTTAVDVVDTLQMTMVSQT